MNLYKFFNRRVRIVDVDGAVWNGFILTYTPAVDTEDDTEEIGLDVPGKGLVEFRPDEIASIEYVD